MFLSVPKIFPNQQIQILFGLVKDGESLKKQVDDKNSFAVIDARLILDENHILAGLTSTWRAERDGNMLTKSIATELLYRLSPSKNVNESLKYMGIRKDTSFVYLVLFETGTDEDIKKKLESLIKFETSFVIGSKVDKTLICQYYKISDELWNTSQRDALQIILNSISTKGL